MRARSSWTRFVAVTLLLYTGAGLIYHIQITEAPIGRCLDHDTRDQLITELTPGIRARRPAYTLDGLRALCGTQTQIRVSAGSSTTRRTRATRAGARPGRCTP